jgi:hypothetical protein
MLRRSKKLARALYQWGGLTTSLAPIRARRRARVPHRKQLFTLCWQASALGEF